MKLNNQSSDKADKRLNQVSQSSETVEYLTVQEFAERAGVSNQAVYERIKKDLTGYTTKKSNRMMISVAALDFVGNKVDNQVIQVNSIEQSSNLSGKSSNLTSNLSGKSSDSSVLLEDNSSFQSSNQVNNQTKSSETSMNQLENQSSQAERSSDSRTLLEYLIKENARLLAEIERLNAIIAEKDTAISDFASRFAAIAEKEQEISSKALATTGQAQMLHAMSEQVEALDAPQESTEAQAKRPWWKPRKGK